MALILAIEPETASRTSSPLPDDLTGHELLRASTLDEALNLIAWRIPDLIVFPVTLPPDEEAALTAHARRPDARHLDSLTIPLRAALDPRHVVASDEGGTAPSTRWFYWSRPASGPFAPGVCDPTAFAAAIREALDPPAPRWQGLRTFASRVGTGGARAISQAGVHVSRVGKQGAHVAQLAGAGAISALRQLPATLPQSSDRPPANRETMPAETRIHLRRVRTRKVTTAVAAIAIALPAGVTWRSEILTFAASVGAAMVEPAPSSAETITPDVRPRAGTLEITSNQEGATVIMGGKLRGSTPLTIDQLSPGTYRVTVDSPAGTITRSVDVTAGRTATLDAAIFPGWLALFAPIELQVVRGGRRLTLDGESRVILPPGSHELELVNVALGYRDVRTVEIEPGETTAVSVATPRTTLSVLTTPPATLWIDGAPAGDAPLTSHPLDVGVHELIVRHPELGERRRVFTATTEPARLEFDLTQPEP